MLLGAEPAIDRGEDLNAEVNESRVTQLDLVAQLMSLLLVPAHTTTVETITLHRCLKLAFPRCCGHDQGVSCHPHGLKRALAGYSDVDSKHERSRRAWFVKLEHFSGCCTARASIWQRLGMGGCWSSSRGVLCWAHAMGDA
jgi:hypothetical protein